jgi:hypothetical protein
MAVVKKAAPGKSKVLSRPVIYTLVAAVAVYAYVLQTQPAPSTHRKISHFTRSRSTASTDSGGITDQDLNAHFARYAGGRRDPFVPSVELHPQAPGLPAGGTGGQWSLTGVNTVDGVTTATVENSAGGDSAFLKAGDHWNGLRVIEINQDSVVFENALGQHTTLSFPGNDLTDTGKPGAAVASTATDTNNAQAPAAPTAPRLPSFGIRPMPVPGPGGNGPGGDQPGGDQPGGGDQNNGGGG